MESNYREILLWSQATSIHLVDLVLFDGKVIKHDEDVYNNLSQEAIHVEPYYKKIYNENGSTIYLCSPGTYMFMSHFTEVDSVGRHVAFCCKVHASSVEEAVLIINKHMSSHGFSFNLKAFSKKKKRNQEQNDSTSVAMIIKVLLVLLIALLIFCVVNFFIYV